MNKIIFSEKLKALRISKGFKNQYQFAKAYDEKFPTKRKDEAGGNTAYGGIYGTIKKYENPNVSNSPSLDIVVNMCDLLGCDVDYLCGRIDEKSHDVSFISQYTGLSEAAIDMLHSIKTDGFEGDKTLAILNLLLSDPNNTKRTVVNDSGCEIFESASNKLINLLYSYVFSSSISLLSARTNWQKDKAIVSAGGEFAGLDIKPLYKESLMSSIREELNRYADLTEKGKGEQK